MLTCDSVIMWIVCLRLQFHILTPFQNVLLDLFRALEWLCLKWLPNAAAFMSLWPHSWHWSCHLKKKIRSNSRSLVFKSSRYQHEKPHHCPLKTCGYKTFQGFYKLSLWSTGMYLALRRMGKFWQRPSDIIDRCRSLFHMEIFISQIFLFLMMETQIQYLPQFHILKYLSSSKLTLTFGRKPLS